MTKDDLIAKATELGLSEGNDLASMNKEQLQALIDGAGDNSPQDDPDEEEDLAPEPDVQTREEIEAEVRAEMEAELAEREALVEKAEKKLKDKEAKAEKAEADRKAQFEGKGDVVVCKHCLTKTFDGTGKCTWCYKDLKGSKKVKAKK